MTLGQQDADAAPGTLTAVGVYSRLGRRPAGEAVTNRNKNIAMFYSSYRLLTRLMPRFTTNWRSMMLLVHLDPNDASENLATPVGIGNAAGRQVAAARERDGMNQLGDEGGAVFNRRPYEDYTNYRPVNTAYTLFLPSRWQPLLTTPGNGTFTMQQFITPQWSITRPYSYDRPDLFRTPEPSASNILHFQDYKAQADEVIAVQAGLTDMEKMIAELFDNKISSLGFSALFITLSRGLSLDEFVHYDFLTNAAAFDGGIATWNEKYRFDAVRPVSAIRFLYGNRTVSGWGGPGKGTVRLPGREWRSYLNTANHPDTRRGQHASAPHTRRPAGATWARIASGGRCRRRQARRPSSPA